MNKTMAGITLAATLVSLPAGAQAEDAREGAIEIDKCQTISQPGSYKLVNNLTGPPLSSLGDCLMITADFVTIDLAGFTISGSGGGPAIWAQPADLPPTPLRGLAVKNGSISNFAVGVNLIEANASIVQGLRVVGGGGPATFGIAANGIVKDNIVISMVEGFTVSGLVTGNYASLNIAEGFSIGRGSTVIGNTATGGGSGLTVFCPSNVTDNTAVNNSGSNLTLSGEGCNDTNNVAP